MIGTPEEALATRRTVNAASRPLEGIRIVDFTFHAAGPFSMHMLAQLGAECIKVETNMRLDTFRRPHPVYGRLEPLTFEQVNANKRSITLNLKTPRGLDLAKRLIVISDLVAESMRPGVFAKLGLAYEDVVKIKPNIVMLSLSACGQTGPDSAFAGYAPLFGAWGGLGYLTGYPEGPPTEIRHVMDHSSGMMAALAAIGALYHLRATGEGQHVDVAAREVASAFVGEALVAAAAGDAPRRMGNDHETMVPHGLYPCSGEDAWVSIAVDAGPEWDALVALLGASIGSDPRFSTPQARLQNRAALDELVAAWTRLRSAGEAAAELQAHGVPACPSWNFEELAHDAHLRARGSLIDIVDRGKTRVAVGSVFHFSKSQAGVNSGTPALGEDNDYVFGDLLGLSEAERRELQDAEVIY
jgi:crotonobetainyl-CoA:carnitine CoA-transferase CaiB-like acyl-CoA transferase